MVFEYNACSASFAVVVRQTTLRANRVYILVYKTLCYFVFRAVGPLATLIVLNVRLIRALGRQRLRRSQMQSSVQGMVATATVASTTNVASMFSSKARRHLRGSSKSGLTTPCEDPVQPSASSTVGAVRTSSQFQTRQRQQNVTAMLVAVVTVFVVCELPDLGLRVAYAVVEFLQAASAKNAQDDDVGGEEHLLVLRYINAATNALLTVNSSVNFIIYYVIGRSFRKVFVNMYSCRSDRLSYGSSVTQCAINDIPTAGRFNHRSTVLSASSLRQKAECKPTEDQQRHQGQDSRYPQTDNQCDQIAVTKEQVPAVTEIDDRKRLDPVVMKIYWNGCSNVCGAAADV